MGMLSDLKKDISLAIVAATSMLTIGNAPAAPDAENQPVEGGQKKETPDLVARVENDNQQEPIKMARGPGKTAGGTAIFAPGVPQSLEFRPVEIQGKVLPLTPALVSHLAANNVHLFPEMEEQDLGNTLNVHETTRAVNKNRNRAHISVAVVVDGTPDSMAHYRRVYDAMRFFFVNQGASRAYGAVPDRVYPVKYEPGVSIKSGIKGVADAPIKPGSVLITVNDQPYAVNVAVEGVNSITLPHEPNDAVKWMQTYLRADMHLYGADVYMQHRANISAHADQKYDPSTTLRASSDVDGGTRDDEKDDEWTPEPGDERIVVVQGGDENEPSSPHHTQSHDLI